MKIIIFFTFILILNSSTFYAQELSIEETLDYINEFFKTHPDKDYSDRNLFKSISINDNHELVFETYLLIKKGRKKKEKIIRKIVNLDIASMYDLDAYLTLKYGKRSLDGDGITIFCKNDEEDVLLKNVQYLNRCFSHTHYSDYFDDETKVFSHNYVYTGNVSSNREKLINAFHHLILNYQNSNTNIESENDPFSTRNYNNTLKVDGTNKIYLNRKESGLFYLPVIINNTVNLEFIIDSGASEISLSNDVGLILIKSGTIKIEDYLGEQEYQFADGTIAKSHRFNLKEVKFGDFIIRNVSASISNNSDAPLLIGQNILERLGKISIDYETSILTVEE